MLRRARGEQQGHQSPYTRLDLARLSKLQNVYINIHIHIYRHIYIYIYCIYMRICVYIYNVYIYIHIIYYIYIKYLLNSEYVRYASQ